jgi:hypothetical protein
MKLEKADSSRKKLLSLMHLINIYWPYLGLGEKNIKQYFLGSIEKDFAINYAVFNIL